MNCSHCGAELPDDAIFCLKCGKPQRQSAGAAGASYEDCEILVHWVSRGTVLTLGAARMQFWVKAMGPEGAYGAGYSAVFRGGQSGPDEQRAHDAEVLHELVERLAADGWESLGRGLSWYNLRFRRRSDHGSYGRSLEI
jgi:hypothetical protein